MMLKHPQVAKSQSFTFLSLMRFYNIDIKKIPFYNLCVSMNSISYSTIMIFFYL